MKRSDAFFATRTNSFTIALTALLAILFAAAGPWASTARAQSSRKDDVVFNTRGQPLAGAQVRVCTATATTTSPCTPLAPVYSDSALTQALANPLTTDGLGNYTFYAAPGRYVIEISGPGITTRQMRDVILPSDPSAPILGGDISAFTLSLSGNLTVAGSAAVTGSLTVGGAPVPSVNQANTWTAQQQFNVSTAFKGPSPWHDIVAYGAPTNGTSDAGPAFSAALLAAYADPGGTVYVPPNPNGFLINTCPTVPTTGNGNQTRILQAANITFGSGCPTWNMQNIPTGSGGGVQGLTWEGVAGGAVQNADENGPTATIQSSQNAPILDFIVNSSVTLRHLDFRCNNGSATTPCIIVDHGVSGTGSGIVFDHVNVINSASSGSNPALLFNGLVAAGGFQAFIYGGAIAVTSAQGSAGVNALQITNWGGVTVDGTHLIGGIGLKYLHGTAAPVADIYLANTEFEATKYPFVLDSDSVSGSGITGVTIINPLIADSPAGGAAIHSLGINGISNVIVIGSLSGSNASFLQSAPINGLTILGSGTLTDANMTAANSSGCIIGGPNGSTGCWGPSNVTPAFFTGPGTISAGTPATGFAGGNDAHHFYDSRNGGNGISYSSLSGAGNGVVARFDGAGAFAGVTLESADSTYGILQFLSPTHGGGSISYQHATSQKSMLFGTDTANNHFVLYSSAQGNQSAGSAGFYGDLHIETAGTTGGMNLSSAPTSPRTQVFQDATGFIALTSQLPLVGTTGSIGGSALAAGACTTGTASVTSTTTSMAVAISPASDPGTGFTWNAWVSAAGTVTARVCNVSGVSATPTAVAYNVRAIQ